MDTIINKESYCAVIGHGSWATALVKVLTMNELSLDWYVRNPEVFESLHNEGRNCRYLPDIEFDMSRIRLSNDVNETIADANIIFLVTRFRALIFHGSRFLFPGFGPDIRHQHILLFLPFLKQL